MFDDIPSKDGSRVPQGLPVAEPPDMFAGVETAPQAAEQSAPTSVPLAAPASAVGAGVLRPRIESSATEAMLPSMNEEAQAKKPILARVLIVIFGILLLCGVGYGAYALFFVKHDSKVLPPSSEGDGEKLPVSEVPVMNTEQENLPAEDSATSSDAVENNILFAEPIDVDGDTIDDDAERAIGTNPSMWDTDGDTLSDGEEINIFETNPLNPDSDGDTYLDGVEVRAGYNPRGPGKLQIIPRSPSVSSTMPSNLSTSTAVAVTSSLPLTTTTLK